jgi:hypothetical protein
MTRRRTGPRLAAAACACLLGPLASLAGGPQDEPRETLQWSLDPYVSLESGSDLTGFSVTILALGEGRLFRSLKDRRAAGPAARLARTFLFDAPLAWWFGVVEHEAFGHGGRAREFGSRAGVHLGSPWGGRDSYTSFASAGLSNDDLLRIYAGGTEGNGWTATRLERELVAERYRHPLELLFLQANRYVASDYVLRSTPDPEEEPAAFYAEWAGGGDVANYLGYLSTRVSGAPGITPAGASPLVLSGYRRLRRQAYWNALDPGSWLALWSVGRHIVTGEDPVAVPLPRLGGRRFLPIFSSDWLPDGGVASLEMVFGSRAGREPVSDPRWFSFVVRKGRGPEGGFGALGAASERLWESAHLRVGGEAEIWNSPGGSPGGGGLLRFQVARGALSGLFFDAGVKSDGHWPGRPAGVGPFARLGARIRLGADPR